jgi:thiol-disulfide isomerase/thioredoxin
MSLTTLDLTLFTGPHCELCDHAMDVYEQLSPSLRAGIKLQTKNIREETELYHLYAVRIPVIKREDSQAELGWPFDISMLEQFVK